MNLASADAELFVHSSINKKQEEQEAMVHLNVRQTRKGILVTSFVLYIANG